jgi:GNAT superfamily N-acetyltransferase
MSQIKVRRVRKEDAPQIARIYRAIDKTAPAVDFKKMLDPEFRTASDASFVAEVDGKVAGFMIGSVTSGSFGVTKCAWIVLFGVDPKFMGQGIGKRLAEVIFEFYKKRKIQNVLTTVKWDSTDILSFLKTLGFDRSEFINLHKVVK